MRQSKTEIYQEVMADFSVHFFTKRIIEEAMSKDLVDAVGDIELALTVVKAEMNRSYE